MTVSTDSLRSHRIATLLLAALALALALAGAAPASAEKLRGGKAVVQNFGFVPLNVGMAHGFFDKARIEIAEIDFGGGTDMAFIAKGAPEIAIATITEEPGFLGISIGAQSTARSADDLKGKKIGVTTVGSLTLWLVEELNRVKGWRSDSAVPVAIGGEPAAQFAAIKTGQVDGFMGAAAIGYQLEEQKAGRRLLNVSEYVKDFELFTTLASTSIIERNPQAVRRFLKHGTKPSPS